METQQQLDTAEYARTGGKTGLVPQGYDAQGNRLGGNPISVNAPAILPTSKPTPVVSSAPAVAQLDKAKETITTSDADRQKQLAEMKAKALEIQATLDKQKASEKPAEEKQKTAEEMVTENPDPGYKFAYNPSDGSKTQIPITASAQSYGMSDSPIAKKEATVSDSVQVDGITYNKLSDGTYTKFNNDTGVGMSATKTDFELSKSAKSNSDKLQQIIDGTYPLDADQLAQVQGLQTQWKSVIKEEQERSANLSGAEAVMQNLYGMGNQKIGKGAIEDVINKGTDRVQELNDKMNAAVAQMKAGFKTDNYKLISDAYKSFTDSQTKRQAQFDQMAADTKAAVAQQKAFDENRNSNIDNDIRTQIANASKGGATPEQIQKMNEALLKHDYTGAMIAGGESLLETSPAGKEYNDYKREQIANGLPYIDWNEYQTLDANRKARIASAGAAIQASGMTSADTARFMQISTKYQADAVVNQGQQAITAKAIATQAMNNPGSAGEQLTLLYTLVKNLDPQSAVREGELALAQSTQSYIGKWGTSLEKINTGKILNDKTIKELATATISLATKWEEAAKRRQGSYKAQATTAGVGDAFDSYLTAAESVPSTTDMAKTETQKKEEAKTAVNTFYTNADDKNIAAIDALYKAGKNDTQIYEYLKVKNLVK
jgi:hypothetical protein